MLITDLVYIDSTGYHFADYPTFLAWIQDQYRGIYGADVYLKSDSQDGQFLAILAKGFYDTAALGASTFNSFSPVTAQGVGLSRNVKINGLEREIPSFSTAVLTLVGTAGTVITNGVAIDTLQQQWILPTPTTIPDAGTIDVTATAQNIGFVTAAANSINSIFTPTRGWQTVNNASAATPGAAIETDATLRVRQRNSTADPSLTVLDGTIGGVSNLTGVTKVRGYENDTASTDGNGIPSHSISLVTVGGDDTAIANEIALHKTPGTGTAGGTSVVVYDAHGMPLTVRFQHAVTATVQAQVTISTKVGWSNDYIALIQAAVAAAINAGQIGNSILITTLYAPAYLFGTVPGTTYVISSLEIGKNGGGLGTSNISLTYDENPVSNSSVDVTVVVT